MSVAQGVSSISDAVANPVGTANNLGKQAGELIGGAVHGAESVSQSLTQAVNAGAEAIISPGATAAKAMNAMRGAADSAAAQVKDAATGFGASFTEGYRKGRNG